MRICSIGECMIELSNINENTYKLSYAGDTANSAIYLSRLGAKSSYITSIGNDLLSKKMVNFLKKEKVNIDNIHYNKNKTIGLYVIKNNTKGERNFFYWRSDSAAKSLFENVNLNIFFNKLSQYEAIYFSGITLSIYDQKSINKFYKLLSLLKKSGIKIYFDLNVRIKNWSNKKIAQESIIRFSQISDIIFMTTEDLKNLGLKKSKYITPINTKNKIIVFRSGNGNINIYNKNKIEKYKFYLNKNVRDTTGCGDAFNACFLFNYFKNKKIEECLKLSHNLGKTVANFKGAIIHKDYFKVKNYVK